MTARIWEKSWPSFVPRDWKPEAVNVGEFLARSAKKYPDKAALYYFGTEISYREFDRLSNQFANVLKALGLKPGDRVALLMPNLPQIAIAYFGIFRAGAVAVPCNPLYTDRELAYQFNDSGATCLVTMDLFAPRMLKLRDTTGLKTIITAHMTDYMPPALKEAFQKNPAAYLPYEKADGYHEFLSLVEKAPDHFDGVYPPLDSLAVILYTGGTTGLPKGVMLSHANVTANGQQCAAWWANSDENETQFSGFPFFHVAGFSVSLALCVAKGWTNIIVPRPEPAMVAQIWAKKPPSYTIAAPTTYIKLLELEEFRKLDLSSLKMAHTGATPVPPELFASFSKATGRPLGEGAGMTEACGLTSYSPVDVRDTGDSYVFPMFPLPGLDVEIRDLETGEKSLPPGAAGEMVFRGPNIMMGYYNKPEETKEALRDGWLFTGDIAKMDEHGHIYYVDRKKDLIIAGAYKISPVEIDKVLSDHPDVQMACAVGVPDKYRGETVKAFIVPAPGAKIDLGEVEKYCRGHLAAYKVPKLYEIVESLPMTAVGKVLRYELRKREVEKQNK